MRETFQRTYGPVPEVDYAMLEARASVIDLVKLLDACGARLTKLRRASNKWVVRIERGGEVHEHECAVCAPHEAINAALRAAGVVLR